MNIYYIAAIYCVCYLFLFISCRK